MYKIERKDYGIKLVFSGFIRKEEMESWSNEMIHLSKSLPSKFGMLIDTTELKPLPVESQEALTSTQITFREKITRSVTITNMDVTNMQLKRLGEVSGINDTKKFLDASKFSNWEHLSLNWIVNGVDPCPSLKKQRRKISLT